METKLNKWLTINSDGDWEHENGIRIFSTDNPGWSIEIDLIGTSLETTEYEYNIDKNEEYIKIKVEENIFKAYCSLFQLEKCFSIFFDLIIPEKSNKNFEYKVLLPIVYKSITLWRPAFGFLTNELKINITKIPELEISDLKAEKIEILTTLLLVDIKDQFLIKVGNAYDFKLKKLNDGSYPVIEIL